MNILLLTQIYPEPDDRDGYRPTRTCEYFAKEWVRAGHDVLVVHCQTRFPFVYYLIPDKFINFSLKNSYALIPAKSSRKELFREEYGIKVCRLPMYKLMPSVPFSKREMTKHVKKILNLCSVKKFKPEIVMGHFVNPCFELTSRVGSELNVRTSFVFHNECTKRNVEKYRIKEYIKGIDIIGGRSIIESESIKRVLSLTYEPFVCYSGVPNEFVESAERKCKKHDENLEGIEFLYAGGLVGKKNVDTIINSFSTIYQDGYHLTIVGEGPEIAHLRDIVKEKGIENAVTFTGRLSRDQVTLKMQKANIFVMVSTGETFGMVYLEAMLQGCIVIASTGGGFDGIINNAENGFLSSAGNEEELTKVFNKIISMPRSKWNQIGQAAINTAIHFSEEEVAKKYLATATQG